MKHKQITSIVIIMVLILSVSGCGTSKYKEQYAQNIEHATKAYENFNSAYAVLHNWSHDVCAAWEYSVKHEDDFSFEQVSRLLSGLTEQKLIDGFMDDMYLYTTGWDDAKQETVDYIRENADMAVTVLSGDYKVYQICVLAVSTAYKADGGRLESFQKYIDDAEQEMGQIQLIDNPKYNEDYYTVLQDYCDTLRGFYNSDALSIEKSLSDVKSGVDSFKSSVENYQSKLEDNLGISEKDSGSATVSTESETSKLKSEGTTKIQTSDGDFNIDVQNVHTVDWKVDNAGMKVVTIQAEVENISYSGYKDNKIQYYEIVNSGVSLLDEDGFALEFYDISGGDDGKYEVGAIFEIGSKKRVSLPFLVPEECNTVSVSVDGHVSDPISLGN